MIDSDQLTIEVQDLNGNWFAVEVINPVSDQQLFQRLSQQKQNFNGKRIRAVDSNKRLVDMIG